MVCKECGKEIPEGRMYCDECLGDMEAQDTEVYTISRMDVYRNKTMHTKLNLTGYVKALPKKNMRLIMLFGAIMTYLAPFIAWVSCNQMFENVEKTHNTANLFELGGKSHLLALESGSVIIVALVLMVSGILMFLCSTKGYTPVGDYFESRIAKFLPVVLTVFAIAKFFLTKRVRNAFKVYLKPSFGILICIIGLVLYSVAVIAEDKAEK